MKTMSGKDRKGQGLTEYIITGRTLKRHYELVRKLFMSLLCLWRSVHPRGDFYNLSF